MDQQQTQQGQTQTQSQTPAAAPRAPVWVPNGTAAQAVAGVVAPATAEARIREEWPTVYGTSAGLAKMASTLIRTVVLAPLGWLLLLPLFVKKISPFVARRYTLTNRRLMIQRGLRPRPVQEVALADIDEVRFDPAAVDRFFLSGTLEIVSRGSVVMTLTGVPEPAGFRQAILNACRAWAPARAKDLPFVPASAKTA